MTRKTIKPGENVFEALGFDRGEATNLKIRADLMLRLSSVIEKHGLTQKKAAEVLGISQPDVSSLVNGRIDKFTIDKLVNMLTAFGQMVELKVKRGPRLTAVEGGNKAKPKKRPLKIVQPGALEA